MLFSNAIRLGLTTAFAIMLLISFLTEFLWVLIGCFKIGWLASISLKLNLSIIATAVAMSLTRFFSISIYSFEVSLGFEPSSIDFFFEILLEGMVSSRVTSLK